MIEDENRDTKRKKNTKCPNQISRRRKKQERKAKSRETKGGRNGKRKKTD